MDSSWCLWSYRSVQFGQYYDWSNVNIIIIAGEHHYPSTLPGGNIWSPCKAVERKRPVTFCTTRRGRVWKRHPDGRSGPSRGRKYDGKFSVQQDYKNTHNTEIPAQAIRISYVSLDPEYTCHIPKSDDKTCKTKFRFCSSSERPAGQWTCLGMEKVWLCYKQWFWGAKCKYNILRIFLYLTILWQRDWIEAGICII